MSNSIEKSLRKLEAEDQDFVPCRSEGSLLYVYICEISDSNELYQITLWAFPLMKQKSYMKYLPPICLKNEASVIFFIIILLTSYFYLRLFLRYS